MEEEVEALKKNKLKLEILDPTGEVIRTHHFFYEALYGSRLRVTVGETTYMMTRDGGMMDIITKETPDLVRTPSSKEEPRYYNPESQDTQKLFCEETLIPVWNVRYSDPNVGNKGESVYMTVSAENEQVAKTLALACSDFSKHIIPEYYDARYLTIFKPSGLYKIGEVQYFEGDPRL